MVSVIARNQRVVTRYCSVCRDGCAACPAGEKLPSVPEDAGGPDAPGNFNPELGAVGHHLREAWAGTYTFHRNSNLVVAIP